MLTRTNVESAMMEIRVMMREKQVNQDARKKFG
jgi:hypothetical protein